MARAEASCFEACTIRISVSLPPAYIGSIRLGVEEVMHEYLMKYRSDIGGVMLTYHNFKLPSAYKSAEIMDGSPFLRFKVDVKTLVFRPRIGSVMTGTVNKCSSAHAGMLVYGLFNASIHADCLKDSHEFSSGSQSWQPRTSAHTTVSVGTKVKFRITELHTSGGIIALQGIPLFGEDSTMAAYSITKKTKRRRQDLVEDETEELLEPANKQTKRSASSSKKKKTKVADSD